MVVGMSHAPMLNASQFSPFQVPLSPPLSPTQSFQAVSTQMMSPVMSGPSTPLTPMSSIGFWDATSPGTSVICPMQQPMMMPLNGPECPDNKMMMVFKLDKYVPPATNPHETLEEKNFRHALPPRLLHKHKVYVESLLGPETELIINVPPGLVELSRKRLSRGDSRYKGLADMNIEAKIVGQFDPVVCHAVLDKLFIGNKRTVKSSRRRCFEVINSVKSLTEATGAFVISRPADECVDVYGPEHVVESAIEYLMSMQSQSGVSKRVIRVSPAAASAIIKARRSILPREQGSLFVEPLAKGDLNGLQTVTIYAYVDASHLDSAEAAIRRIEIDLARPAGVPMMPGSVMHHHGLPPPVPMAPRISAAMVNDGDEDSLCPDDHMDPCIDVMQLTQSVTNSISHSPPPLLEDLIEDEVKRRSSLASPKALLAALKMGGAIDLSASPKSTAKPSIESLRAIQEDVLAAAAQSNMSSTTSVSSQGLSPLVSHASVTSPPDTPPTLPEGATRVSNSVKYVAVGKPRMIKAPMAVYPQAHGDLTPGKTSTPNVIGQV
eukprot:TRINITY_DN17354_c0_g1_i2.p1 TRINITY_DN17354_c0_g1~~TRINITY_DN17354_c0_g1_i2.p1  ORF type:complete len:549 (+),score=138.78 TRINITY_DN17354_c0_g1_i2:98-1744(+)